MSRATREAAYTEFVVARQDRLRRVAFALCGDWHQADDLVQLALIKLYVAWPRVQSHGSPEAYARQILVRTNIDEHRRRTRRPESVTLVEDGLPPADAGLPTEERAALIDAVQLLPEMQRKVVVLRHWLGLSVAETAHELGIGEGTVKSHSSRGVAALQRTLTDSEATTPGAPAR